MGRAAFTDAFMLGTDAFIFGKAALAAAVSRRAHAFLWCVVCIHWRGHFLVSVYTVFHLFSMAMHALALMVCVIGRLHISSPLACDCRHFSYVSSSTMALAPVLSSRSFLPVTVFATLATGAAGR